MIGKIMGAALFACSVFIMLFLTVPFIMAVVPHGYILLCLAVQIAVSGALMSGKWDML